MDGMYLLLDVGGTEIKGGIMDSEGRILKENLCYPARAKEGKEAVLEHFAFILSDMAAVMPDSNILGAGFAFPGPFDYEKGISLMKGLSKYDSIYGISIEKEIKKRYEKIKNCPFCFLHDVEAFAVGASYEQEAAGRKRLFCLCLGTGAGSAFIENHLSVKNVKLNVPENGWIYNTPFQDSIIDDYLSVRGLAQLSAELLGEALDGKRLYELCSMGVTAALKVYYKFGQNLAEAVVPFLESYQPDAVVLGGQITKSFGYFGDTLSDACRIKNIEIIIEENTSACTMRGLFKRINRED